MLENDRLLTVRQVASRLQLGLRTVYEHISEGRLRAVRTPTGSLRIRESDLDDFLQPVMPRDASKGADPCETSQNND